MSIYQIVGIISAFCFAILLPIAVFTNWKNPWIGYAACGFLLIASVCVIMVTLSS